MIKNGLLLILLVISSLSCKKGTNIENQPANPTTTQPVATQKPPTMAYIAVVNASGDTIRSNPVNIIIN